MRGARPAMAAVIFGVVLAGAMALAFVATLAMAGGLGPMPAASRPDRSGRSVTVSSAAGPAGRRPVGSPVPGGALRAVIAFARAQLGAPYQWGGDGPDSWDCSGLVMAAYDAAGIRLPHNAEAQYVATASATVPLDQLQPGDLVFFGSGEQAIGHVGIYVGEGEMIDAPHTGAFVRLEPISWTDLLVATRPLAAPVPTG